MFNQSTGKRTTADKTGIQNDVLKSNTKQRSEGPIPNDSLNLTGLTKYLSEIKSTKMEEEYKVCWTKYRKYPADEFDRTVEKSQMN